MSLYNAPRTGAWALTLVVLGGLAAKFKFVVRRIH